VFNPFRNVIVKRAKVSNAGKDNEAATGDAEMERVYHPSDVAFLRSIQSFCPDYFEVIQAFGLGNLWQRPTLSPRDKELVVFSTLITQGDTEIQLRQHVHTALKRGMNLDEILECIILLAVYVGVPRTLNAINIVRETMKEMG
jgi:4-carboxymuconolactone decarboxylase